MNLLKDLFSKHQDTGLRRRSPLFIRIAIALFAVVILITLLFGHLFFSRYQDSLYAAEFDKGWLTLSHLGSASRTLLLEDDFLQLNRLIKDYSHDEAILFSAVVDHQEKILAHSDPAKIGSKYISTSKNAINSGNPDFTIHKVTIDDQTAYELKQALQFKNIFLGTVYLGMSQKHIDSFVDEQKQAFLRSLYFPLLMMLLVVLVLSVVLTVWIKFFLFKLLTALQGLCRGDFNFQLDVTGNNEFSDLASEVKHLSNNLQQRELMQSDLANYLNFTTIDKILESPQKNGSSYASRRQVTVLYAGIAGFGEYASNTNAEEVVEALNEYVGIATNTILAHGGYVDKFMGDAVVGIFGVSVYREDHTRRAVRAAWDMQTVLNAHDKGTNQVLGKVRIGMSSGVVLSGNIGSLSRIEYSSIGESIKEAFWLNGLAAEKEIIISKGIYQIIKDDACAEPLTPQKMIGHEGVLESYRLQRFDDSQLKVSGESS